MLSSVQKLSFGTLHIGKEEQDAVKCLTKRKKDKNAFKEACNRINEASGDHDVYLRTAISFNSDLGYIPLAVMHNNKIVSQELFNVSFKDKGKYFAKLADEFVEQFNGDAKCKCNLGKDDKTMENKLDSYA